MKTTPAIRCRKLPALDLDNWQAVEAAFRGADFAPFQQGWTEQATTGFRPAKAAAAWTDDALIVLAELCDDDIYNTMPVSDFNQLAIQHGDVFEIFLQPAGQEAYYEIHVTPHNHHFQIRLPFPGAFQKLKGQFPSDAVLLDSFKVWQPVVDSRVQIDAAAKKWRVVVRIPLAMLAEKIPAAPGAKWRFSFCRYDYTRGRAKPVVSSTTPHTVCNFHRREEWGLITFAA